MHKILLFVLLFLLVPFQFANAEISGTQGDKYYFEEGLKHYQAGEYELALEDFLQAVDLNPKNRLAVQYVHLTGEQLKIKKEKRLLAEAIKDYEEKNYEAALDKFVQVLDLNPGNTEATGYIQRIKAEKTAIEEAKTGAVGEEEKPEPEKPAAEVSEVPEVKELPEVKEVPEVTRVGQEISKLAQDIEIIKRQVAKRKPEEPKVLPTRVSEKKGPVKGKKILLFLIFASALVGAFFAYKKLILKEPGLSEKNLRLLEDLSKTATTTEHKEEILNTILRAFMETVEAKSGALLTADDKTGDLILTAWKGLRPDIPRDLRFKKDSPLFAEVVRITSPTSAAEILADGTLQDYTYENLLLFREKPAGPSCLLLLPLYYKNRNVGMVLLCTKRHRKNYLRKYRGLMETLAGQAAIIVANIAYDRQVIIDGLTGLYVHWFFYQCLEKEISRAERQNSSLALLMLDLDNFKQFNDAYGHPLGDKALVQVAEILKSDLRDIDTVARYGGEEFAIILPGVDEKLAFRTAERIRKGLENYRFKVVDGKFRLTLSIGISIYGKGITAEQMVEKADKALYWVKQHGKNQVTSWNDLPRA